MLAKYLIFALTLITFLVFGFDKWLAKKGRPRISENVLLMLTFLGGTFGAIMGMVFFKHKNAKKSFFFKLCAIILLQILLIFFFKEYLLSIR